MNTDCTDAGLYPICRNNVCTPCQSMMDCDGKFCPTIGPMEGYCVDCIMDMHCKTDPHKGFCSPVDHQCRGCT